MTIAGLTVLTTAEVAPDFPQLARALDPCRRLAVYRVGLARRFRGLTARTGVLVEGEAGWGEISPFSEYGPAESARWFAAGLEAATRPFPRSIRSRIPVNATIPVCDPDTAAALVTALPGVSAVKVKVADPGVSLAADCARLEAVRGALQARGGGTIRVDANAAWTLEQAEQAIRELDRAAGGLEYCEQPVAEVADMATLRRRVSVPLAADESVRRATDPLAVVRAGACDLIVTKVQPLGGVRAALALAQAAGVPVVVSSAVDSSVGLAMGAHLAAALPELPYACGLGTHALLTTDVTKAPLAPEGGAIDVRRVAPDRTDLPPVADTLTRAWLTRLADIVAYREAHA